jgi:hypothetical protein
MCYWNYDDVWQMCTKYKPWKINIRFWNSGYSNFREVCTKINDLLFSFVNQIRRWCYIFWDFSWTCATPASLALLVWWMNRLSLVILYITTSHCFLVASPIQVLLQTICPWVYAKPTNVQYDSDVMWLSASLTGSQDQMRWMLLCMFDICVPSRYGSLGCDSVLFCWCIPTFWRTWLPRSLGSKRLGLGCG